MFKLFRTAVLAALLIPFSWAGASAQTSSSARQFILDAVETSAVQNVGEYRFYSLQISGTFVATAAVQWSNNLTDWTALSCTSATATVSSFTAAAQCSGPLHGRYFRVNMSAYTSGSMTVDVVFHRYSAGSYIQGTPISWHVLFTPDNTFDIGAASSTRPRNVFIGTDLTVGATLHLNQVSEIRWDTGGTRARISSPATDRIQLTDAAGTGAPMLLFGGTTSSFPSIKRNAAAIDFRLADDSAYASIGAADVSANGTMLLGQSSELRWAIGGTRARMSSPSTDNIQLHDSAGTGFGRLMFGGTTSSFPALKRSAQQIDVKLADDSGYAVLAASYTNVATGTMVNGKVSTSASSPTISSGFGTSPSVTAHNGTIAFRVNVGTGGTATNGVIGLATATTGWNCFCNDITTQSATVFLCKQTASTTTTATIGNFNTSGAAAAWAANDILAVSCFAY